MSMIFRPLGHQDDTPSEAWHPARGDVLVDTVTGTIVRVTAVSPIHILAGDASGIVRAYAVRQMRDAMPAEVRCFTLALKAAA